MIHAFGFDDGVVSHMNRRARTRRFELERRLGDSYFSGMNTMETDPKLLDSALTDKEGVANTSVIWHGAACCCWKRGTTPSRWIPTAWNPTAPGNQLPDK
jgi:carotenoid cleavage dioxygenase